MRLVPPLIAITLLLPACLDSKETFTLEKDGSGTLRQVYVTNLAARDELLQMAALLYGGQAEMGGLPYGNPVAPAWVKALALKAEGYVVTKVEETSAEGRRTTSIEASFKTLEAAAQGGAFFTSALTLERVEKGGPWRLVLKDAWQAATAAAGGEVGGQEASALLGAFEPQLKGLSLTRTIRLPTRVTETTGALGEDGRTVTWTVDYAKLAEGKDLVLSITFEHVEGLQLEPFRHAPDMESLVKRCLEAPPTPELPKPVGDR